MSHELEFCGMWRTGYYDGICSHVSAEGYRASMNLNTPVGREKFNKLSRL